MIIRMFWIGLICSFLCACGGHDEELLKAETIAKKQLARLETALQDGKIRNAVILRGYCDILRKKKPELQPLLRALEKEATLVGPLYTQLEKRLQDAAIAENYPDWQERLDELISIRQAANLDMYNDALSDTVNVVADLSDGELKRVNALSKQQSMQANKSRDYGHGSQYIGNHHYGRWNRDPHTGMSFWAWYGMYSMFSDLTGGRRHYYSSWSQNRGYSYYHDVGRRNYTSPKQRNTQNTMEQRSRKQFGKQGKKFNSPYNKRRTGASQISKASRAQTQSPFKSGYAKSRSRSSNIRRSGSSRSSLRSGSGRTSRGFSRGK